jgi:hypothetical protein
MVFTFTFTQKASSPLFQFKEKIFGSPEQALKEAYQAALTIQCIEEEHFHGGRIPIESADNNPHFPSYLRETVAQSLTILQQKTKEFNRSSSAVGKLGPNHLEKLILVEGILAKYSLKNSSSSSGGLDSMGVTDSRQEKNQFPSLKVNKIIDVVSASSPLGAMPRVKQPNINQPSQKQNAQSDEPSFTQKKKGILPRSLTRAFHRIQEVLHPEAEENAVHKFRSSKEKTVISLRLLSLLIIVPLLTQQVTKHFLVMPIVQQLRAAQETPVFLNSEMKEEALEELHSYEEELKLESILHKAPPITPEVLEEKVQHKAKELEEEFRSKSNNAISNVFADILGFLGFALVLILRRTDIPVLKSFIDDFIYGLSDSAKAFVIILVTDMFVGFHSPHGWEVILEGMANHLGVVANASAISLFIATVPVIADTILKYWLFRYLSQMSPSTKATIKEMND